MTKREELFWEMIRKTEGASYISIKGTFDYAFDAAIAEVRKLLIEEYEKHPKPHPSCSFPDATSDWTVPLWETIAKILDSLSAEEGKK